ncbi:hypothetical protein AFK68_22680 [Hydrocoleum sp. CS-953]|uniref:hypothetical protein n=1 Tax=Hydrocoleum sp. CS-953 TaxID=1671698 RepID=UPI000B9B480A|nr:hypothetical protein [Hydrocoleum sp. CS-953]OZH52696.1 hypothetical protein AFK68_22680 [Hydrocoleum sp. CS-953]
MTEPLKRINDVTFVDFEYLSYEEMETFEQQGFYEALPLDITYWGFFNVPDKDGVYWGSR